MGRERMSSSWRAVRTSLFGIAIIGIACVSKEYVYREVLEVKGSASVEQRQTFARAYASASQRERLLGELRTTFPDLGSEMKGLFISWSITRNLSGGGQTVQITVGIRRPKALDQAAAIRARLRTLVESDLRRSGY